MSEPLEALRVRLNSETGRLAWKELERHFARGVVIRVAADHDLVETAIAFARDDKAAVERWITAGSVARASADEAQQWHREQPEFWAVVVAPWVLVQRIEAPAGNLH